MSEDLFYIDVLRSKPIHIYDVKLFLRSISLINRFEIEIKV